MNQNLEKIKTKYIRAVNAINIVAIYNIFTTILFLIFEKYTIPYTLEAGRWVNFLGLRINETYNYIGTSIALFINIVMGAGLYFLSYKSKRGDLRFYVSIIVIYVIDSILSIFYFDIFSFLLHLMVLAYLIYGHYSYTKLVVEFEKYKEERKKGRKYDNSDDN